MNMDECILAADLHSDAIHVDIQSPFAQLASPHSVGVPLKVYLDLCVHKHPEMLGYHANTKKLTL